MKLRNMTSIYITKNEKMLLLYKEKSKFSTTPIYAGIGGHFEKEELNEPDECIFRELFEEAKITNNNISNLKLKYITMRNTNSEIRQQYIYFADLLNDIDLPYCNEGTLKWIDINEVINLPMTITNFYCLKHYFNTGKIDNEIYLLSLFLNDDNVKTNIVKLNIT